MRLNQMKGHVVSIRNDQQKAQVAFKSSSDELFLSRVQNAMDINSRIVRPAQMVTRTGLQNGNDALKAAKQQYNLPSGFAPDDVAARTLGYAIGETLKGQYEQAQTDYDTTLAICRDCRTIHEDDPITHNLDLTAGKAFQRMAMLHKKTGDVKTAADDTYRAAHLRHPQPSYEKAVELVKAGDSLRETQQYQQAGNAYVDALRVVRDVYPTVSDSTTKELLKDTAIVSAHKASIAAEAKGDAGTSRRFLNASIGIERTTNRNPEGLPIDRSDECWY